MRRLVLYPLYVLAEVAIIATDLAELLGSAVGFCLLIPKLPLWGGVVLTAADVLIFLSISDPSHSQGRPVKMFEYTIIALVCGNYYTIQIFSYLGDCKVFAVFFCFIALLIKAEPDWSQVFIGYLPNGDLFQSDTDAIYVGETLRYAGFLRLLTLVAIGILGATVMPHALFLGSSIATQDRVSEAPQEALTAPSPSQTTIKSRLRRTIFKLFRIDRVEREVSTKDHRSKYGERENNSLTFIRQHLTHGIIDIVSSLIAIAVPINSASVLFSWFYWLLTDWQS